MQIVYILVKNSMSSTEPPTLTSVFFQVHSAVSAVLSVLTVSTPISVYVYCFYRA